MRLFTLLLLGSLLPVCLSGQKLKDEKFQIEYLRLPTKGLPDSMHTYSVDLSKAGDNLRAAGLTESSYAKLVALEDFKKVPSFGHIQITVSGAKYNLTSAKTTKHSEKYKDKEGNEKTRTQYSYDLSYSVPISVVIRSHTGEILVEKIVGSDAVSQRVGQRTTVIGKGSSGSGGMYSTAAAATENYKQKAAGIKKNAVDKSIRAAISAGIGAFRAQYDLTPQKQWLLFEIPSGKKAPEAEAWLANATIAVAIAKEVKAREALTDQAARMAGPLQFWEDQLGKYDPTDKKQKKLFYAAASNLTTAYLMLEDVDNAKKYATKLTDALKMKGYEMAQLKKKVTELETQLALPEATTRHFPLPDRTALEPPTPPATATAPAAAPQKAPVKLVAFDTVTAYVIQEEGGEKIAGKISLPNGRPMFKRYRKNIKFWNQAGEAVSLNPENVHELGWGKTKLVTYDRPTGTTGLKKRASYLKVDTDAGPIRLLTLVPYYSDQDPVVTDFLEIPEEDKLMALAFTNARWLNWRKSFAELFTDCPVLYAEIRVGYYKNSVRDVRRALQTYKNKPCE